MKQAPQLAKVVFDRGARQAKPVAGVQLHRDPRRPAAAVLDILCLVQHHQMPCAPVPVLTVTVQQRIRRDDQVLKRNFGGLASAVFSVQHQGAQRGRETLCLTAPVAQQAHRRQNQHWSVKPPGFFFQQHMGQRLQRFAEAHVVGQHAAQALTAQQLKPRESV